MLFDQKSTDLAELFAKKEPESAQDENAAESSGQDRVVTQIVQGSGGQDEMEKLISHWVEEEVGEVQNEEAHEQKEADMGLIHEPITNIIESGMNLDFVPNAVGGAENALDVGGSDIRPIGGGEFGGGGGGGGGDDGGGSYGGGGGGGGYGGGGGGGGGDGGGGGGGE